MKMCIKLFVCILTLCASAYASQSDYLSKIIAVGCADDDSILPEDEKQVPILSFVIISYCHLKERAHIFSNNIETAIVKPLPHFTKCVFIIELMDLGGSNENAFIFRTFYEKLLIPSTHHELFVWKTETFKKYPQYSELVRVFKDEFLRSRWNLDTITLFNSKAALNLFMFNENQMPISIQQENDRFGTNNISDLPEHLYHINSGYGQQCNHLSLYHKLQSLTNDYNAYDRIFCDTFEYHHLKSFRTYWNTGDMFWMRGRLIRDEILSSFPPDASNAVYYASPKLTFVVLKRLPITWQFPVRPFNKYLWAFLICTCIILEMSRRIKNLLNYLHFENIKRSMIKRKLFGIIVIGKGVKKLDQIKDRYQRGIEILAGNFRTMITAAYAGMILVGILHPLYPWTPSTFEELNTTTNYYICTAFKSPEFIMKDLMKNFVLNRIKDNMKIEREIDTTPADYLARNTDNGTTFYASVMYDDKMNLWMKGRAFLGITSTFLNKLKPANDQKLPEIRYISVAAGATRLHFLIKTLKWVITGGSWMRWHYLEQNYYKNVAPIMVDNMLRNSGAKRDVTGVRSLTINDVFFIFVIQGCSLVFTILVCVYELWYYSCYNQL